MQVEGHVLQPLLLGRAVGAPAGGGASITAGMLVAGIFGALIAVPIVACANMRATYLIAGTTVTASPRNRRPITPARWLVSADPALDRGQRRCRCASGAPSRGIARDALVGGGPGGGQVGAGRVTAEHPAARGDHRAVARRPRCRRAARPSALGAR